MKDEAIGVQYLNDTTTDWERFDWERFDWERLRTMSDSAIGAGIAADPDALPTDDDFWKGAKIVMPAPKETITIRLDADLLAWFRQGKGYQTKINAVLRAYVKAQSETQPRSR